MRSVVMAMAWVLVTPLAAFCAEPARVAIVLTPGETYRATADILRDKLTQQGCACTVVQLPVARAPAAGDESAPPKPATQPAPTTAPAAESLSPEMQEAVARLRDSHPKVIVAIGGGATSLALQAVPTVPVVFCLVPNALDRSFMDKDNPNAARVVGVTTDISPELQIDQIRRLSPKATRVGLFHGPRSRRTAEVLRAQGEKAGLSVILIPAVEGRFADALRALGQRGCDAALMIPDSEVYNPENVQAVLLWGLRERRPVWGFSTNVVKAGAFAGLYPDPAAVAQQTVGLAMKSLRGQGPPERGLRYPEGVRGGVNERTAEMLDIPLDKDLCNSVAVRFQKH